MKTCGKCGGKGHNARTCESAGGKKHAQKPPAATESLTVTESLVARQKQLQRELAVIDRVLADLNAVGIS